MLAGWMCNMKIFGRKYTMVVGALATMAFFFAYTQVCSQYSIKILLHLMLSELIQEQLHLLPKHLAKENR